jgi:hypothetical protein
LQARSDDHCPKLSFGRHQPPGRNAKKSTGYDLEISIKAMNPDPHMLKAPSAIDCASGVLINNQVLQRNSTRDESIAIAALATAIPKYFSSLITSPSPLAKSATDRQAPYP